MNWERWSSGFAGATGVLVVERLQWAPPVSARQEIPLELYSGHEVFVELGINNLIAPSDVSTILDAVVRLIRKNRSADKTNNA